MSQVIVTRETLIRMKDAMNCFQADVQDATTHIKQDAAGCTENIHRSILWQNGRVEQWKRKISALGTKIDQCEAEVSQNKREQQSTQERIEKLNTEGHTLHQKLQNLIRQKQNMAKAGNVSEINALENSIASVQNQINGIETSISRCRTQLSDLVAVAHQLNMRLKELKDDYNNATLSLHRAEEKLSKMESAGKHAIHCIETLLIGVENFRRCAIDRNSANLSGISQCLSAIDEYASVTL